MVQIYRQTYLPVCDALPMPAFYICGDISVNSGVGTARKMLRDAGAFNGVIAV